MSYYPTRGKTCHICELNGGRGIYYSSDYLFTATDLHSRANYVHGYRVSDYMLIKSRCGSFHESAVICSHHRHLLCEGYMPPKSCVRLSCCNTTELMHIGVQAALFIGNVPIFGYICNTHRVCYEERMLKYNRQPVVITGYSWSHIWDCVFKQPSINTEAAFSGNTSSIILNQCKTESRSTITDVDSSNPLPVENGIKTNEMHLAPYAEQDVHSHERDTQANQQHQLNESILAHDPQVVQVTETKQVQQRRKLTSQSQPSRSSPAEPMETQRYLRIKICASVSTTHIWEEVTISETDVVASLKAKIIDTFALKHSPSDLSLLYNLPDLDNICWKTLNTEEENQTLTELSFDDDYIVTCDCSERCEKEFMSDSCDGQQSDRPTAQYNVYPLSGLENCGNTCYMNSALQCLNHVEQLFNYFRGDKIKVLLHRERTYGEKNSVLTRLYSELIESLCSSRDSTIVPIEFYSEFGRLASRFCNYQQHDSLEFMNILLDILHEDLMRILQQKDTIVSKTFHGKIQTVVTCQRCNRDLKTDDSFSFLPLPIPEKGNNSKSSCTRACKLTQCFDAFLQGEQIGNYGQWYCEYCNKLTDASKNLYLKKLPPILILQLKRFNYDLRSYTKNNTTVEYDLKNLDLNKYVVPSHRDTNIRYKLIAVSNHWGDLIGGHFVTYAKLPGTEDWYKYNDDRVGKIDKNMHANNYSAYILVYQQERKDSLVSTSV